MKKLLHYIGLWFLVLTIPSIPFTPGYLLIDLVIASYFIYLIYKNRIQERGQ